MMIVLPIIISNKPLYSKWNERKLDNEAVVRSRRRKRADVESFALREICDQELTWFLLPRSSIALVQLKGHGRQDF
jgi:hypothetical protein